MAATRPAEPPTKENHDHDERFWKADPGAHAAVDDAYHAKYDRYGPGIVGSVVGPDAEAVTIRLVPP